jgi:predicted kinase
MKKILYVFIGRPGSGKTTLLRQLEKEYGCPRIDIFKFVSEYGLKEAFTKEAYLEMYKYLENELEKNNSLILELGTNHPELNIRKLKELKEEKNLSLNVFLCMLSIEECKKRCTMRQRQIEPIALDRRLKRIFPQLHKNFLETNGIEFIELPMEKPVEENVKFLEKFLK